MKEGLNHNEILKQEQKLSPEQIFLLKVIQTPRLELLRTINEELEQNPILEDIDEEEEIETIDDDIEIEEIVIDNELKELFRDDIPLYFTPEKDDEEKFIETPVEKPNMKEFLLQELHFLISDEDALKIGEYIIESINEQGFLDYSTEEIASDLNIEEGKVIEILKIIQGLEPKGIGSRDLKEFLLIQAKELSLGALSLNIIENYFDEVRKSDIVGISKKLNIPIDVVKEEIEKIKNLKPFPAYLEFGDIQYVVPDVVIEEKEGELKILIKETDLPTLRINPDYFEILQSKGLYDEKTLRFVREKIRRAFVFLKALEIRRKTFKKIIEYIIQEQKDFILKGVYFKKPLRLMDISKILNVHISTISRMLKGIYIQTPDTVLSVKELFSVPSHNKDLNISRESLKERIRLIIEKEKEKPLKDEEIVKILEEEGIKIKRRTVAKYREELGIPPANIRRKQC